jgi:hypothetical protein
MKKLHLQSVVAMFFMAIGIISCTTEPIDSTFNDDTDGGSTAPASFQVNIGTDLYQATTATGHVESNVLTLTATNATGAKFVIQVPAARGTYSTSLITYTPNATESGSYTNLSTTGVSGSVTIASYNATTHKVSGTFNFTGYWTNPADNRPSAQFTNGVFTNITFTDSSTPTPTDFVYTVNAGSNLFTATQADATLGVGMIKILGTDDAGRTMAIQIYGTTTGRYTGDQVVLAYMGTETEGFSYNSLESSAIVEITEIDATNHTITGTFSFRGEGFEETDTLEFTNGVLTDVPYTTDNVDGDLATAVFDGTTTYDYKNSIAYVTTVQAAGSDEVLTFPLVGPDHWITFDIKTSLGTGAYPLSTDPTNAVGVTFTDANGNEYSVSEGTIGITSNANNRIAGTYTLVVKNAEGVVLHNITGTFDIDYLFD